MAGDDEHAVRSPMGGTVIDVHVAEGDAVRAGDSLLVVSAMKMESVVTSPRTGRASSALLALRAGRHGRRRTRSSPSWRPATANGDAPVAAAGARTRWLPVLDEVAELQGLAAARLAPGFASIPASCASAAGAS